MKKAFKDLTERGQKQRLKKYAAEREARGTQECLVRLAKPAKITDTKDKKNRVAFFRFYEFDKETQKVRFFNATAFIEKGKDALEAFYASLGKNDLVSLEYKQNGKYTNVYNLMDRRAADARNKAERQAQKEAVVAASNEQEVEL